MSNFTARITPDGWPVIEVTYPGTVVLAVSGEGALNLVDEIAAQLNKEFVAGLFAWARREADRHSATQTAEPEASGVVASGDPSEPSPCRCVLCAPYRVEVQPVRALPVPNLEQHHG